MLTSLLTQTIKPKEQQIDLPQELEYNDNRISTGSSAVQAHAMRKRDAKWKAYGFDASVLNIADPGAGRNLWFQQLTHS